MTQAVLVEERGGLLLLTLNRPEKYNALNRSVLTALREQVDAFAAHPRLKVLLIKAAGRYFSAGADLSEAKTDDWDGSTAAVRTWYRREMNGMLALYLELENLEKPVVVAHQGPCVGGGLELSLSCDFRLASASATYSLPEGSFGSLPATGGVSRLTRLVGPHWAKWMIMGGKPMDAAKAAAIGLVHEVFSDAAFESEVIGFCEGLVKQPSEFLAMAKLAVDLAADLESAQARRVEQLANSALSVGKEHQDLLKQWVSRFQKPRT